MPDPDLTDITLVLDRSGSMSSCLEQTIAGFNRFLAEQKAEEGQANLTLIQFDDEYEVHYAGIPIGEAVDLTPQTFVPRGSTALLDAMGRGMAETLARLNKYDDATRPGKVLFVTLTDGHENASAEHTTRQINAMIRKRRGQGWAFVFLGADQDAIATAGRLGIDADSSVKFAARRSNHAMSSLSGAVGRYRRGKDRDVSFTDEERRDSDDEA